MSNHVKGLTSCRPPESEISTEKSNESQMDLINRRDAVNAIEEVWCKWDVNTIDRFRDELQERFVALPSAQPNLQPNLQPTCNQLATDCISRQEAIDAVCKAGCGSGFCGVECDEVLALRNLPPAQPDLSGYSSRLWKAAYERGKAEAQPDIIHCGECKYYHDSDGCFFSTATTGADGFCHWAERKEGEADEAD